MADLDDSQLLSGYQMVPVDPSESRFRHRVGGIDYPGAPLCPVCDRALRAYVVLDPSDRRLGIEAPLDVLPILYCHNCETPADLFAYRLDRRGNARIVVQHRGELFPDWPQPRGDYGVELRPVPERLNEILLRCPKGWYDYRYELYRRWKRANPDLAKKPGPVGLPPLTDDEQYMEAFEPGQQGPQGIEGFHQFGGLPFWLQPPQRARCPGCSQPMPFLLSLGSDERLSWEFGDWGRLYVFFCASCLLVAALLQCG